MDKHRPWRPQLKNAPLFNPFEPWGDWIEQFDAGDQIESEGEEPAGNCVSVNPATVKTDDK